MASQVRNENSDNRACIAKETPMKTKFFVATAIVAGALVYAALAGPVSAQPRGAFHNFRPPVFHNFRPLVRVFAPQVYAPRLSYNFPTYNNYATPYLGYSAGYATPYYGYSAGYATPYSGYSSNVTPFGTSYSAYAARSFPRYLTPYGSYPVNYNAYSGSTTPFGSTSTGPYGGCSTNITPFGTSYSAYGAQSFPRGLTPYGSYPTTYGAYSASTTPFGSTSTGPYGGNSTIATPFGTSFSAQSFPSALTPYGSSPTTYGVNSGNASPFSSTFGYGYVSPYTYGP
jgi:hypothetical protein